MALLTEMRTLLNQPPTRSQCARIATRLSEEKKNEEYEVARKYVQEHLQNWPEHACVLPTTLIKKNASLRELIPNFEEDVEVYLQRCQNILEEGDTARAFDFAWSAWRRNPVEALHTLVRQLDECLPKLTYSGDTNTQHAEWLAYTEEQDVRQLGQLLKTISVAPFNVKSATERLKALKGWCDDPRTAAYILRDLEIIGWTSSSSRKYWTQLFQRFQEQTDPILQQVQEMDFRPKAGKSMGDYLEDKIPKALSKCSFPQTTPLSPKAQALVDGIQTHLEQIALSHSPEGQQHWRAVFQAPEEPAPKDALAAYLQQQDDPRGEFIQLQRKEKPTAKDVKRMKDLQKEHREEWLQQLAPALLDGEIYKDGFLHDVNFGQITTPLFREKPNHPLLHTIERMQCYLPNVELLANVQSLTQVRALTIQTFGGLHDTELDLQGQLRALPFRMQLQELHLRTSAHQDELSILIKRMWGCFEDLFPQLTLLTLRESQTRLAFTRDEADRLTCLRINSLDDITSLESAFWSFPSDAFTQVTLGEGVEWPQELDGTLATQTHLQTIQGFPHPIEQWTLPEECTRSELAPLTSARSVLLHWYLERPNAHQHDPNMTTALWLSTFSEEERRKANMSGGERRAVSPERRWLAQFSGHYKSPSHLTLWDREDDDRREEFFVDDIEDNMLAFGPDQSLWIIRKQTPPTLQRWCLSTHTFIGEGVPLDPSEVGGSYVNGVYVDETRHMLYLLMFTGELLRLDMQSATLECLATLPVSAYALLPSSSGRWFLIKAHSEDGRHSLYLWDQQEQTLSEHPLKTVGREYMLSHPNDDTFFLVDRTECKQYPFTSAEPKNVFRYTERAFWKVCLSPKGNCLSITDYSGDKTDFFDVSAGRHICRTMREKR